MKTFLKQFRSCMLAAMSILCLAVPGLLQAQADRPAKVPHSAFERADREDLAAPLREKGEIRVIIGEIGRAHV